MSRNKMPNGDASERKAVAFEIVPGTDIAEIRIAHPGWSEDECRAHQSKVAMEAFLQIGKKAMSGAVISRPGYDALWSWFSLSRAAFLTLPRVLMHEMPDEWQGKMAALLEQYDGTFTRLPDIGCTVRATRQGKLVEMPTVYTSYRHPDRDAIERLK